jgi:glycosyltransferase involved in cell wall biosynthesis
VSEPTVSVVIPTFNRARLVVRAIDSVLTQTYRDFEVVVVDDGSTDGTREALAEVGPPVRVIHHEVNRGRSAARNTGIRAARGRFIGFLDADDLWLPEKLERQVPLLESGADVAYSLIYVTDEAGTIYQESSERGFRLFRESAAEGLGYSSFLRRSACQLNTVVVRRSCIDEVGTFDEEMAGTEDLDFIHRLLRRYRFAVADEPRKTRPGRRWRAAGRCSPRASSPTSGRIRSCDATGRCAPSCTCASRRVATSSASTGRCADHWRPRSRSARGCCSTERS